MFSNNHWQRFPGFAWVLVGVLAAIVTAQTNVNVCAKDIGVDPRATLSSTSDMVGFWEGKVLVALPLDASFSVGRVSFDVDVSINTPFSFTRLDVLSVLDAEVTSLAQGALKGELEQSLVQANKVINAIRSASQTIFIDDLYDELKLLEKALDKQFIDLVDDSTVLSPRRKARLLLISKPIEKRYDYVKYITNKIRLYARDGTKDKFVALLREIILDLAEGKFVAYCADLGKLLKHVEKCRGNMIKEEEADRIRYKIDFLLRKIGKSGVDQAFAFDFSTMIADVEVDGGLSFSQDRYRAPSKDVCNQGFDASVGYAGDEWSVSASFLHEKRDYSDRLKDKSDRTKKNLGISISRSGDLCSVDLSASLNNEFYPNYIDDEIEESKSSQAISEVTELVGYTLGLKLLPALENDLVDNLGEKGALGALAIRDRCEAVDCLEDFIDDVADAEWDGDIEADKAEALINMALAILPRRRICNMDVPLSFGFPFRDGDATVDVKWENKIYPAHTALDKNTSSGKISYTTDKEASTLSGYVFGEKLSYPNASTKDRSVIKLEGTLDEELSCGDLSLTLFEQLTTYPLSYLKDRLVRQMDLDIDIDAFDVDIDLDWKDKLTKYPNDIDKMVVKVTELEADLEWETDQGKISISLGDDYKWEAIAGNVSLEDKVLVKRARQAEISWDGEIVQDLELTLSFAWSDITDFIDPGNDSQKIVFQVEFDIAL